VSRQNHCFYLNSKFIILTYYLEQEVMKTWLDLWHLIYLTNPRHRLGFGKYTAIWWTITGSDSRRNPFQLKKLSALERVQRKSRVGLIFSGVWIFTFVSCKRHSLYRDISRALPNLPQSWWKLTELTILGSFHVSLLAKKNNTK